MNSIELLDLDFSKISSLSNRKIKFKDSSFVNILGSWNNFRASSLPLSSEEDSDDTNIVKSPAVVRLEKVLEFVDIDDLFVGKIPTSSRAIKLRDSMMKKLDSNCDSAYYFKEFSRANDVDMDSMFISRVEVPVEEDTTGFNAEEDLNKDLHLDLTEVEDKFVVDDETSEIEQPLEEDKFVADNIEEDDDEITFSEDDIDPIVTYEEEVKNPVAEEENKSFVKQDGIFKLKQDIMDQMVKPMKDNVQSAADEIRVNEYNNMLLLEEEMAAEEEENLTSMEEEDLQPKTSFIDDADILKTKIRMLQKEQETIDEIMEDSNQRATAVDEEYAQTVKALRLYADRLQDACNERYKIVSDQNSTSDAKVQDIEEMLAIMNQ